MAETNFDSIYIYSVRIIDENDIHKLKYEIDPHTVTLKDHGVWYALDRGREWVSFLCIRIQRNELYIGEVFTPKEHRKNGYFTTLLKYVSDILFPEYAISTHALITSKAGFEACGFKQYSFRHFKYGDQWWLRRDGKKYDCKKV